MNDESEETMAQRPSEMTTTMQGVEIAARILRSAGHYLAAHRCEALITEFDVVRTQFRIMVSSQGNTIRRAEGLEKALELTQQELNVANKVANDEAAKVSMYAEAARVIALHLKDFCDESLPYDEMISDAARKAGDMIQKAKERNALMELELKNVRSIVDDQAEDLIAARRQLVEVVERTEDIFSKLDALATHHRRHAIEFESEQDNAIAEAIEEFIALHCLVDFHSPVKQEPPV